MEKDLLGLRDLQGLKKFVRGCELGKNSPTVRYIYLSNSVCVYNVCIYLLDLNTENGGLSCLLGYGYGSVCLAFFRSRESKLKIGIYRRHL